MKRIDKNFKEFWVPIIYDKKKGRFNLVQLKKELFDYWNLMEEVPKVYDEITNGLISKCYTKSDVVISVYQDELNKHIDEHLKDIHEKPFRLVALEFGTPDEIISEYSTIKEATYNMFTIGNTVCNNKSYQVEVLGVDGTWYPVVIR